MFQTILSCYLWDLVDEGIDEVLDRVRGEAGVTGVSVAACCPRVALLRPHRDVSPRTFRSEGGLQFQPNREAYEATRVRPVVAEWLRKANPLADVAEACEKRGLVFRMRVTCCRSPVTVARFESAAVKDIFGGTHPEWLCPSNPDVREYLRSMIADVSAYRPAAIELDAVGFPSPAATRADRDLCPELGPAGEWLLSLCFCESCRQAATHAGLDTAAAARSAKVILERALATGEPVTASIEDLLRDDPILSGYASWREEQVTRLVALLKSASGVRLVLRQSRDDAAGAADHSTLARNCDALLTPPATGRTDEVEPGIEAALADIGDIARVEVGASACAPECPDSATLVRALSGAVRAGIKTAVLENYGLLPIGRLAWIKQAARYAVREAE